MSITQKKHGHYLGTRIEHKRWRRYTEGEFMVSGEGEYWLEDDFLFFQHHARQQPIKLPLQNLAEIKICPCQSRTGGIPVIKLVWEKDGHWLTSEFVLSGLVDQNNNLLASLRIASLRS